MSDTTDCLNAEVRGGHHAPGWLWCNARGLQPTPRIHCGVQCHAYLPPAMAALQAQEPEPERELELPDEQTQEDTQMAKHGEIKWDGPANDRISMGDEAAGKTLIQWVEGRIAEGQSLESIAKIVGCAGTTLRWAVNRRRRDAGVSELTSHRKPRAERVPQPIQPDEDQGEPSLASPQPRTEPGPAETVPEPDANAPFSAVGRTGRTLSIQDPVTGNDPAQEGNEPLGCTAIEFATAANAFFARTGIADQFATYLAGWLDAQRAVQTAA